MSEPLDLDTQQFRSFGHALDHYSSRTCSGNLPHRVAIAAAGPVMDQRIILTNSQWSICEWQLRNRGFAQIFLMNDFAALAHSMATVKPSDMRNIGPALRGAPEAPVSIMGAGTGFGVACLVPLEGRAVPLVTEGGHIAFAPDDDEQIRIFQKLKIHLARVSIERILSGSGLEILYRTQRELQGRDASALSAAQLTQRAMEGDPDCHRTLSLFCCIYGAVAGDIALVHGARGGVQEVVRSGVTKNTRRCVRLLTDSRSNYLTDSAVHEIRVRIKKSRPLLRLLRAELGEDRYARVKRHLQQTSRALASARDAPCHGGWPLIKDWSLTGRHAMPVRRHWHVGCHTSTPAGAMHLSPRAPLRAKHACTSCRKRSKTLLYTANSSAS